jgi:hypothetical protein
MIPPAMTEERLLGFLETQVEATPENYRKYMRAAVGTKQERMKFYLDDFIEAAKKNKTIKVWTGRDKEIKGQVQEEIPNAFMDTGLITEATRKNKAEAIKGIMYGMFDEMAKSQIWDDLDPDEMWQSCLTNAKKLEKFLGAGSEDPMRYSAAVMRFLEPEDRLPYSFFTWRGTDF